MWRRALGGLLLVAASMSLPAVSGAASRTGSHPSGCGDAVRRVSDRSESTPVLFVHGFAGDPSDFRRRLAGRSSMLDAVGELDGVTVYTFDYSDRSLEWVTDPAIGPPLGVAIACLAGRHDQRVTVVAHSMGGLATREAQGETVDGRRVSDSLARVVTVGTPFEGAQLLGFGGGLAGEIAAELIDTALEACSTDFARRPDRSFCSLLGATETAAVQGMIPDSDELAALPDWGEAVRIVPMAGEIDVGVAGPFGLSESFSAGDFAVSVASATADASRGVRPFVASCHASLFGIVDAIDDSPCSHANEVANRRIVRHVRDAVRRGVRSGS
jgi:triacylglycerol lipase